MIRTKEVRDALVTYDEAYEHRWYDAVGAEVVKFIPQVGFPRASASGMTITLVNSAAATVPNLAVAGELFSILTTAAEYDGACITMNGESFDATKPFYFGCKLKVDDATKGEFALGLGEVLTAYIAAAAHTVIAANLECVGFFKAGDATTLKAIGYVTNTQKVSVSWGTAMDTSFHIYEVYYDGATCYWYMDGVLVTSTALAANLPDGDITPFLHCRTAFADAHTYKISWIRAIQVR